MTIPPSLAIASLAVNSSEVERSLAENGDRRWVAMIAKCLMEQRWTIRFLSLFLPTIIDRRELFSEYCCNGRTDQAIDLTNRRRPVHGK